MLKALFLLPCIFTTTLPASYTPTDEGSSVKFKIKNFGLTVNGSFTGLTGSIEFTAAAVAAAKFDVTLASKSVNTGNNSRDNHLRKEEYFDVVKYPAIRITSTKITSSGGNAFMMYADLSIKNVTRTITFPFTAVPEAGGYRFTGEFKINRRNFGVGGSSFSMSDNLTVLLNVKAK